MRKFYLLQQFYRALCRIRELVARFPPPTNGSLKLFISFGNFGIISCSIWLLPPIHFKWFRDFNIVGHIYIKKHRFSFNLTI